MPEEYWWPQNEMWEKHFFSDQAAYGGAATASKYFSTVNTGYGESSSAEQFCEKAQLMNIEVMKAIYEGWQDNLWNTASGLLFWMSQSAYPCFIWQTEEDELVPVENSYLMAEALHKARIPYAHYVFPKGFHGLSVANDDFFNGWSGGMYVMDQVFKAAEAVKAGKGVNVSDERRAELEAQFPDDQEPVMPEGLPIDQSWREDAGLWPSLAEAWIKRL